MYPGLNHDNENNENRVIILDQSDSTGIILPTSSFYKAGLKDAAVAFTGSSVLSLLSVLITEMELDPVLKGMLLSTPFLSTMINQVFAAKAVGRDGGKKFILTSHVVTTTSLAGLTLFSALTDPKNIKTFGYPYVILWMLTALAGSSTASFMRMIDLLNWRKTEEQKALIKGYYSAVVDLSTAIGPIGCLFLEKLGGFKIPFAAYTGLLATGSAIALTTDPSPFKQVMLKNKNIGFDEAKKIARAYGQLESTIYIDTSQKNWRENFSNALRYLISPQGVAINLCVLTSLGLYFVTVAALQDLLKQGFNISQLEAVITASIANSISIAARIGAGKIIANWEKETHGIKTLAAGYALSALSAIPLILPQPPRWLLYASVAGMNIGFGSSLLGASQVADPLADPKNKNLESFDLPLIYGFIGTFGTLGGVLFPILLGLMANLFGQNGYRYFFLFTILMNTTSACTMLATYSYAMHPNGSFGKAVNLFKSATSCLKPAFPNAARNSHSNEEIELPKWPERISDSSITLGKK